MPVNLPDNTPNSDTYKVIVNDNNESKIKKIETGSEKKGTFISRSVKFLRKDRDEKTPNLPLDQKASKENDSTFIKNKVSPKINEFKNALNSLKKRANHIGRALLAGYPDFPSEIEAKKAKPAASDSLAKEMASQIDAEADIDSNFDREDSAETEAATYNADGDAPLQPHSPAAQALTSAPKPSHRPLPPLPLPLPLPPLPPLPPTPVAAPAASVAAGKVDQTRKKLGTIFQEVISSERVFRNNLELNIHIIELMEKDPGLTSLEDKEFLAKSKLKLQLAMVLSDSLIDEFSKAPNLKEKLKVYNDAIYNRYQEALLNRSDNFAVGKPAYTTKMTHLIEKMQLSKGSTHFDDLINKLNGQTLQAVVAPLYQRMPRHVMLQNEIITTNAKLKGETKALVEENRQMRALKFNIQETVNRSTTKESLEEGEDLVNIGLIKTKESLSLMNSEDHLQTMMSLCKATADLAAFVRTHLSSNKFQVLRSKMDDAEYRSTLWQQSVEIRAQEYKSGSNLDPKVTDDLEEKKAWFQQTQVFNTIEDVLKLSKQEKKEFQALKENFNKLQKSV